MPTLSSLKCSEEEYLWEEVGGVIGFAQAGFQRIEASDDAVALKKMVPFSKQLDAMRSLVRD